MGVYDIAFAKGVNVFASVGADGSMRMFDLRSLEHSTIMYESPEGAPLIRLAWNKQDPNYLSTIMQGKESAVILDIRVPTQPLAELRGTSRLSTHWRGLPIRSVTYAQLVTIRM